MLDLRGIPYEERHHRAVFTAWGVARHEHVDGHGVVKVVVVLADRRPVELVLPADRRVVLERVGKLLRNGPGPPPAVSGPSGARGPGRPPGPQENDVKAGRCR